MNITSLLSDALKVKIRLGMRGIKDLVSGRFFKFSKANTSFPKLQQQLTKIQPITDSLTVNAKINNLKVAAKQIENHVVYPGKIFSFWKAVGSPIEKNGFKSSRTIVKDELSESIGGGLCQIAGLVYYMSLEAGLKITERFEHSLDLYTDETRYTPLGSDASVVYGRKDLRIENNYNFPIRYTFEISNDSIKVILNSSNEINLSEVTFKQKITSSQKIVTTFIKGKKQTVARYSILKNSQ